MLKKSQLLYILISVCDRPHIIINTSWYIEITTIILEKMTYFHLISFLFKKINLNVWLLLLLLYIYFVFCIACVSVRARLCARA